MAKPCPSSSCFYPTHSPCLPLVTMPWRTQTSLVLGLIMRSSLKILPRGRCCGSTVWACEFILNLRDRRPDIFARKLSLASKLILQKAVWTASSCFSYSIRHSHQIAYFKVFMGWETSIIIEWGEDLLQSIIKGWLFLRVDQLFSA